MRKRLAKSDSIARGLIQIGNCDGRIGRWELFFRVSLRWVSYRHDIFSGLVGVQFRHSDILKESFIRVGHLFLFCVEGSSESRFFC